MIAQLVELAMSNPSLTFLILGFVASGVVLARSPKPLEKPHILEAFFSYFILFNMGFGYVNNFVMHTVYAEFIAGFIGWPNSPF